MFSYGFFSVIWAPNVGRQARLEAAARELGKRKARSFSRFLTLPVENRTCHFYGIRLSTFDCSPWSAHEASVPISPVPQVSTRGQLARSLGPFVSLFLKARGLRHGWPIPVDTVFLCSDSYAPSDSPLWPRAFVRRFPLTPSPLLLTSREESPVCSMEDANGTMEVACCSPCPVRALRLPRLGTEGRTGWPL